MKCKKQFIILLVIIVFFIYLFPYGILYSIYMLEMRPKVELEINAFEKNLSQISDPQTKVREIANYTVKDYYQTYGHKSNPFLFFSYFWFIQIHGDIKSPRIKSFMFLENDPYFIAYYKTGACMEAATLFNFIANKSGFESRIVGTKAEDHQWNEIKIYNNWIHVDPTIYYHYISDPNNLSNYKNLWINNTNAYNEIGWYPDGYSKVVVIGTNEDLTEKYCKASNLSVICENCNYIKIEPENGKRYSIDQEVYSSEVNFILGQKNYSITAVKDLVPFLIVKETSVNASLIGHENLTITIIPEKIGPTIYSSGILILIIFIISLYDVKHLVKWYRVWKRKRN